MLGDNGSGKTTLSRVCSGLLTPQSGTVIRRGRTLAVLSTGFSAVPNASLRETLVLHGVLAGEDMVSATRLAETALDIGGLHTAAGHPINTAYSDVLRHIIHEIQTRPGMAGCWISARSMTSADAGITPLCSDPSRRIG